MIRRLLKKTGGDRRDMPLHPPIWCLSLLRTAPEDRHAKRRDPAPLRVEPREVPQRLRAQDEEEQQPARARKGGHLAPAHRRPRRVARRTGSAGPCAAHRFRVFCDIIVVRFSSLQILGKNRSCA